MEQEKAGRFIAMLRKEKGLTQKELAELLHITDKAVSKWECGNCLPDNALMLPLCNVLEITVNELLSGERLSTATYHEKAEENIMTLIQENTNTHKKNKRQLILSILAVVFLTICFFWFINHSTANQLRLSYFVDFIAISIDMILPLIMLILGKQLYAFCNLFKYNFHRYDDTKKVSAEKVKEAKHAGSFAVKSVLLSGGICSVIYFVNWMRCLDNTAYWGPSLAKIVLGIFYSLIISGFLLILKERIS